MSELISNKKMVRAFHSVVLYAVRCTYLIKKLYFICEMKFFQMIRNPLNSKKHFSSLLIFRSVHLFMMNGHKSLITDFVSFLLIWCNICFVTESYCGKLSRAISTRSFRSREDVGPHISLPAKKEFVGSFKIFLMVNS